MPSKRRSKIESWLEERPLLVGSIYSIIGLVLTAYNIFFVHSTPSVIMIPTSSTVTATTSIVYAVTTTITSSISGTTTTHTFTSYTQWYYGPYCCWVYRPASPAPILFLPFYFYTASMLFFGILWFRKRRDRNHRMSHQIGETGG